MAACTVLGRSGAEAVARDRSVLPSWLWDSSEPPADADASVSLVWTVEICMGRGRLQTTDAVPLVAGPAAHAVAATGSSGTGRAA